MLPQGFVLLSVVCRSIRVDMMYCTEENFTGEVVPGYNRNEAIVTEKCAAQLSKVQEYLSSLGLGLKIKDAYRPQKAISAFKRWSEQPEDWKTKRTYYPDIDKGRLFELGYISQRSAHNRGSTEDLTVVRLGDDSELDMGTRVDFLGQLSHTESPDVSEEARKNRRLLKGVMERHGFENYWREWWHYQLRDEPFTATSITEPFDFDVE